MADSYFKYCKAHCTLSYFFHSGGISLFLNDGTIELWA